MTRHFLPRDAQEFSPPPASPRSNGSVGRCDVGAEFVVVCGDVFEDHRVSARIVRQALDRMAGFTVPVYLMPGNHDPFDAASIYRSEAFVRGCPATSPSCRRRGSWKSPTAWISSWHRGRRNRRRTTSSPSRSPGCAPVINSYRRRPRWHRPPVTRLGSGDPRRRPVEAAVRDEIIDFVALGDRHSVTDLGSTGRIWYSGAHETTNFDDVGAGPARYWQSH